MNESPSDHRKAENEVVFREYNEQVEKGYEKLKTVAKEDGQEYTYGVDDPLQFFCECSDENCRLRIKMKPSEYNRIHENRSRFVIVHGHETKEVEYVVERNDRFNVVEKFFDPPQSAGGLNKTDAKNV